jgi:hypothetical protein
MLAYGSRSSFFAFVTAGLGSSSISAGAGLLTAATALGETAYNRGAQSATVAGTSAAWTVGLPTSHVRRTHARQMASTRLQAHASFDQKFSIPSIQRNPMYKATYGTCEQGSAHVQEPMSGPPSARRTEPSTSIEWAAQYPALPRSMRLVQTHIIVSNPIEPASIEKVQQTRANSTPAPPPAVGSTSAASWYRHSDVARPEPQNPLPQSAASLYHSGSGRGFFDPMLVKRRPLVVTQAGGAPERFAIKTAENALPRRQVRRLRVLASGPPAQPIHTMPHIAAPHSSCGWSPTPHALSDMSAFAHACFGTSSFIVVAAQSLQGILVVDLAQDAQSGMHAVEHACFGTSSFIVVAAHPCKGAQLR